MSKTSDKWDWIIGHPPPQLDPHSKVKHQLVRDYLYRYIRVLMANERMPRLKLSLVDGFAGGGLYDNGSTTAYGSPLLLLKTVEEANVGLNLKRLHTPRQVDTEYHFVEFKKSNFEYLKHVLNAEGYGERIGRDIALYQNAFEDVCRPIIAKAAARKGGQRALFLLDQYAYDDIELATVRNILTSLQGAEVILTFNVDSLLAFLSDNDQFHAITRRIGLEKYIDWTGYSRLKAETRWREIIQRQLAYGIWKASGARFMTLFFVTPRGDTPWSYWLVHLSNAYKANDVMKAVHWEHGNSFGHSLEAGLFQIGYQANQDESVTGQRGLGFAEPAAFDQELYRASVANLSEQLPRIIYDYQFGVPFIELMESIANRTNATAEIVKESLHHFIQTKEIEARTSEGGMRMKGTSIHRNDIIVPHKQRSIFIC
ncbi:three-Cys-motif partner protein TcmP [Herbaspirillum sp. HC18]|nr:three-Cys-motif partner protein TcmP [Herbaspirillum sp. HC18]